MIEEIEQRMIESGTEQWSSGTYQEIGSYKRGEKWNGFKRFSLLKRAEVQCTLEKILGKNRKRESDAFSGRIENRSNAITNESLVQPNSGLLSSIDGNIYGIFCRKNRKMRTTMALSSFFLSYHQIGFKHNIVILILGTDSIF